MEARYLDHPLYHTQSNIRTANKRISELNPQVPVALLVAPAGYGKTTALAEWAERDERPFAWIAIEEADNDPGRLLGSIAGALHDLEPIGPDVFGALSAPEPRFSSAALARSMARRASATV